MTEEEWDELWLEIMTELADLHADPKGPSPSEALSYKVSGLWPDEEQPY